MKARARLFARPGTAAGFALAGIDAVETDGGDALLLELGTDRLGADTGVILVEEEILATLAPAARLELERQPFPVLVSFPGPRWAALPSAAESYVLQILQRAIGYRVRLR
jgi:vacuolar-type H+-ATPase subunit F/Vma7